MEELNEPTPVDNSESTQGTDPNGQSETEDKFGGDYDKLRKSYSELESMQGRSASDMAALREEMTSLRETAQTAQEAADALAARDGISKADALKTIREESTQMLEKYAPQAAQQKATEKITQVEQKLQKMELLNAYPDAKEHMELVRDLSASTGKPMKEVYESRIMSLTQPSAKPNSYSPSYRHTDEDAPQANVQRRKQYEAVGQATTPRQRDDAAHDLLKSKLRDGGFIA